MNLQKIKYLIKEKSNKLIFDFLISPPDLKVWKFLRKFSIDTLVIVPTYLFMQNKMNFFRALLERFILKKKKILLLSYEHDGRFEDVVKKGQQKNFVFLYFPKQIFDFNQLFFYEYFKHYNNKYCQGSARYVNLFERYTHPDNKKNRNHYGLECERYVKFISWLLRPACVVVASGDDTYSIELSKAFKKSAIKWAVVEREGTMTQRSAEKMPELFQSHIPIQADYFFAANELHMQGFSGALKSKDTKKYLLGELRADKWIRADYRYLSKMYNKWNNYSKKILFLTFGERNYIEPIYHSHVKGNWRPLLSDVEDCLYTFAKNHPDFLIYYKMGHIEDFHEDFINRCKASHLENVVALNRDFPCEELLNYSDLVVGFQTTAMIEALFTKTPTIYLNWGFPEEVDVNYDILPLHESQAFLRADSRDEFLAYLEKFSEGVDIGKVIPQSEKDLWIERYFYNSNGKVADRFISYLEKELITNAQS